jgi:hypothetical protein
MSHASFDVRRVAWLLPVGWATCGVLGTLRGVLRLFRISIFLYGGQPGRGRVGHRPLISFTARRNSRATPLLFDAHLEIRPGKCPVARVDIP